MKKHCIAFFAFFLCVSFLFSKNQNAEAAFTQSCQAFQSGDWNSAVILLRKAVSYKENDNDDTWYMLINSEMYAGSYVAASTDCDLFLEKFPNSSYVPYVRYQKGRTYFYAKEYDKSILLLSDFCHQYNENEMYASSLFWIAESFFETYNYTEAKPLYERIIEEFPNDPKAPLSQEKLELIAKHTREEKLLYLLKKTGEAYLTAKEGYEKQIKMYDTVSQVSSDATNKLSDLQKRNTELETEIAYLKARITELENYRENEAIRRLKEKAHVLENILDGGAK
ncbi:MAG: tetratricopeptide repeat protein [Treponema sp.]|nr:tetratricopeptide repeat protein [Treponema sp.]